MFPALDTDFFAAIGYRYVSRALHRLSLPRLTQVTFPALGISFFTLLGPGYVPAHDLGYFFFQSVPSFGFEF